MKGCNFKFCKHYPKKVNGKLKVNEFCKMCIHYKPFNFLEKEENAEIKNNKFEDSKDQNKK